MKIYVASSWRNESQPMIVGLLRTTGYEVYDFRHPTPGESGFSWREIDPAWQSWTPEQFRDSLEHPIADEGFQRDYRALCDCDVCLLLLPCGRSAHLEAGFCAGRGKRVVVFLTQQEPELMYLLCDFLTTSESELLHELAHLSRQEFPTRSS